MSRKLLLLLLFGVLQGHGHDVGASTPSDYTDSIVYSITSPFRNTIEFLIHVWNVTVDTACYPFFKALELLQITIRRLTDVCTFFIDCLISLLNIVVFSPLIFVVQILNSLIDIILRYPLIFIMDVIAGLLYRILVFMHVTRLESNLGDSFASALALPVDKFVDTLHTFVYLLIQMPLEFLFHGVIEFLLANGIKFVIFAFSEVICFIADIVKIPFLGISMLLNGVVAVPLLTVLKILCLILFCIIDPIVYFFYLIIAFLNLCVLALVIVASTIYIYNYAFSNTDFDITITEIREVTQSLTRRFARIGRQLFSTNKTRTESTEDDHFCAVCFEDRFLFKLVPCKHRTTCMDCLEQIMRLNGICPICRSPIQGYQV